MDRDELTTVYTVSNPVKAEVIKNALEAEGIRCFLDGEGQAGEVGLSAFSIQVQVPAGDAQRAADFIRSHEQPAPEERE